MTAQPDRTNILIDLVALARQAGRPHDLPTDKERLSAAVARVAEAVRQLGAGNDLAAALAAGASALSGRERLLARLEALPLAAHRPA